MANIYDMKDTWNDGATAFTAIKMDVTDVASDSGSLLLDLKVGGVTKASINKDGGLTVTTADINAGTIDGTVIGGTTPAAGTFTTFTSTGIDDNATSTAITIDASENVGIGTSSPSSPSGFARTVTLRDAASVSFVANANDTARAEFAVSSGGGWISTADAIPLRFATNQTERMRIDASGNVGIGTSSPGGALTVASSGGAGVAIAQSNENFYAGSLHRFYDLSYANERMRIDSSGNLLVGTATNANNARINVQGASGARPVDVRSAASSGSAITMVAFYDGASDFCGQITIDAGANTTQYVTSSDYRLKNTIAPMTGALAKVAALKPVTYKWNSNDSDGQGFIAHELAEVVPEAVCGSKDAVDAEGNPVYQGIDTSFLVATLTAAIQEQQEQINELKAKVAKLKGAN